MTQVVKLYKQEGLDATLLCLMHKIASTIKGLSDVDLFLCLEEIMDIV